MRKDLELDVEEPIRLEYAVDDERIAGLVAEHDELIAEEVRADEVGAVEDGHRREWAVEDVEIEISIQPLEGEVVESNAVRTGIGAVRSDAERYASIASTISATRSRCVRVRARRRRSTIRPSSAAVSSSTDPTNDSRFIQEARFPCGKSFCAFDWHGIVWIARDRTYDIERVLDHRLLRAPDPHLVLPSRLRCAPLAVLAVALPETLRVSDLLDLRSSIARPSRATRRAHVTLLPLARLDPRATARYWIRKSTVR